MEVVERTNTSQQEQPFGVRSVVEHGEGVAGEEQRRMRRRLRTSEAAGEM